MKKEDLKALRRFIGAMVVVLCGAIILIDSFMNPDLTQTEIFMKDMEFILWAVVGAILYVAK